MKHAAIGAFGIMLKEMQMEMGMEMERKKDPAHPSRR
jgi:hypothetical protein